MDAEGNGVCAAAAMRCALRHAGPFCRSPEGPGLEAAVAPQEASGAADPAPSDSESAAAGAARAQAAAAAERTPEDPSAPAEATSTRAEGRVDKTMADGADANTDQDASEGSAARPPPAEEAGEGTANAVPQSADPDDGASGSTVDRTADVQPSGTQVCALHFH